MLTLRQVSKIDLPDCLRGLPDSFASSMVPGMPVGMRHAFSTMPKSPMGYVSPTARRAFMHTQTRALSSAVSSRSQKSQPVMRAVLEQRRMLFNGATSRNILAHLEEQANRNPNSATVQYAFYQALMKANMPAIILERYQSNMFASNSACETLYNRALGALGQSDGSMNSQIVGQANGNLSNQQLQAIGQAVAASTRGANVSISSTQPVGSGTKDTPLYVVVDETIGSTIFKWIKLFLYFGLFVWLSTMFVGLVVEAFQSMKKVPGKQDNEAKAEHQKARFSDVHGCDEAKEELQELVDFLKNPDKFSTLGGKLPKGVLLVGPPGTGKTLLARAVAGESGVPFFFMSGSEFDEIYVGVGAKRVRELFAAAKSKSPSIVFIDELDAIGGKRNARDAAYAKQTLNQLLTELDGFDQNSGVIIIAATNFPEALDSALTRPGRFDRNVVVGLPDVRGRIAILKHHMKKIIAGPDVIVETLASSTPGVSGAELENIVNQAAVHASRAKAQVVSMFDFEWAKDKVMMGAERRSMVITPQEKEMTAYHEAGHALALMFTHGADPLHKITILPRGQALGITFHLPEMDKYSKSMYEYRASIDVCMGGKVAEQLVYGDDNVTSGAASVSYSTPHHLKCL
jgi:ATP-dependent metalloprotease